MKALVYTKPNEVKIIDREVPVLVADEAIVKIDAVGICGSDMHAFHGHDPRRKPGLVLGHEFSGTVLESDSSLIAPGTRVTGNPLITCGHCIQCQQGRNNLCANRTMIGMTRPGAFAEYMSIPASCLIPIPDDIAFERAALAEPLATALHAINLSRRALTLSLNHCNVLIIGGGAIGLLAALLLKHLGVSNMGVAEINPKRRSTIAQEVGCTLIDPTSEEFSKDFYDLVIDCVGSENTRKLSFQAVTSGGVITHIGLQDWASEIDMRKLTLAEITLIGSYTYTMEDLRASVRYLHEGVLGLCNWVDQRPLSQGPIAFDDLHHGRAASAKIILKPFDT